MDEKLEAVNQTLLSVLRQRVMGELHPHMLMGTGFHLDHNVLSSLLKAVRDQLAPRYTFSFDEKFVTDALALDMVKLAVKIDGNTR
jgi:hypothetical protein